MASFLWWWRYTLRKLKLRSSGRSPGDRRLCKNPRHVVATIYDDVEWAGRWIIVSS